MDGDKWKGNTIGASYGYSLDKSNGVSTLVDINGDGLPDKVFRKGGALYYRPQIPTSPKGEVLYGDDARIVGVSSFSKITSSTHNGGAKATVGYQLFTAEVGVDFSSTKTKTTEYLSDINGDGLVDLVSGGKVYFNHIEFDKSGNAIPTFTLSSADTPSPIIYSGKIDASVIQIDPTEQAELIKSSPMEDMVRVWQAPKNGTVSISGTVSLITPTGDYDADEYAHADGVRVAIQKGSAELWNKKIAKGDATAYNATAQDIAVKKGDRIYFRVQSGTEETSNGAFDNVKWAPVITYAGTEEKLPNGLSTTVYKSEEGAIYDAHTVANIAESTSLGLSGKFTKPVTTDDVTLKVYASNNETDSLGNKNPKYRKKEIYTRTFAWNEAFDGELQQTIPNPDSYTNLKFEVSSTSNVDWSKVRWTPQVEVTAKDGSKQQTAGAAHYVLFADMVNEGKPVVLGSNAASLSVTPSITVVPSTASGTVTMTVKAADKLLGKKTYTLNGSSLSGGPLTITGVSVGKIWIDYSYSGNISGQAVTSTATVSGIGTAQAGFYAQSDNTGMGMLYRGWGGFAYNASEGRYGKPIDESLLKLPDSKDAKLDPRTMAFTPIGTDQMTFARWIGQNEFIYLTADTMGTARLGEQQVILTNPLEGSTETAALTGDCLQGTGASAVTLVSTSKSTVKQGGSMGITYNEAGGTSTTDVTMTDMNGDGYPDIIAGGTIQYTNTQGGLSGEKYGGMGKTTGKHSSKAWGAGGKPVASGVALLDMMTPYKGGSTGTQMNTGLKKALNNLRTSFLAKISISGNIPENTEDAVETFMDINGDGLPDKILTDRRVRLNLGYSFADPIAWDIDRIQGGKTNSYNMSIGAGDTIFTKKHITEDKKSIVKASGSVSGGVGLVTSRGVEEYDLIDINSDGLPDKVWMTDDKVFVALNKGDGFTDGILWKGTSLLSENISTAESVNGAFTYTIFTPMPTPVVKICLNPGTSTGHSINRTTYSLQDVDGDGYLDIVESDKESELKVTRSAIGRTNMLRSVTNSLGGTFTLDYAHSIPTYGLPGGKWVMSSVTVDDGIHDDGPLMKTVFAYSDGQKDRHEREFLGFGKVVTKNIDTEKGDSAVYRQAVQLYDVSTYYAQGNELGATVEDANGNKYTETKNEYDGYYLTANGDKYTFAKQEKLCSDRASAFVPLRYTANRQYEGKTSGITTSEAWNEYYLDGYHGELKSYKFSDKGRLGENGSGSFDYQTAIQYASNDAKHIFGLPVDVTVTGGDGKTYHHVSAKYDMNYADHPTQIRQQLGGGEAVSDYVYDAYGNITKTTLPANGKGQRMWYSYRYEPVMNMYVERVDDAFGYRSEASNFDYRYGMALQRRDLNNFYYETDIDNLGRVKAVRGPNELATGVPYIIAFDYQPKATFGENGITAPAYAVTKHYDVQHPSDDLETVTLVDGFGRPVQVKKDGVVTTAAKGSAPKDENVMIVSGRNVYDAFGRVAKAYYPTTEALGSKTAFNKAFDNVSPTVTVYDVLDRAMKVTLPDNSTTQTEYSTDAGSNTLKTLVTDALGNRQATYTDGSGKTVKTEQLSGPDGTITTSSSMTALNALLR